MKRSLNRILSLVLCISMLFGSVYAGNIIIENMTAKAEDGYKTGDLIEYGNYPQSKVTDESIISTLNSMAGDNSTWTSYGYYSGTGSSFDGQMTAKDYMRYIDISVTIGPEFVRYRGVYFDSYRPRNTGLESTYACQEDNGYNTDTAYWFKYEPLRWRVLDSATGLILCEDIIDSQAYNNYILKDGDTYYGNASKTYYASNYYYSSIREWLNDDFYNTAFTTEQKNNIRTTTLDNGFGVSSSNDKIFLLSYEEVKNTSYGFASDPYKIDRKRIASSTSYAKCQGVAVDSFYSASSWWLRSPEISDSVRIVDINGRSKQDYTNRFVGVAWRGVRPACTLSNLRSDNSQSEITLDYLSAEGFLLQGKSTKYNKNLASYCAEISSISNQNSYDLIKQAYEKAGYREVEPYNYGGSGAFTIGYKIIDDTMILLVTTKGTTQLDEGVGDALHGGTNTFFEDIEIYHNIWEYEENAYNTLADYVSRHSEIYDAENLKVLITGHSVGGACANALAAKLTHERKYGPASWISITDTDSIFCYTFGAIKVLTRDENVESGYENIHNVYNFYDTYSPNGNLAVSGVGSFYAKFGHTDLCYFKYLPDANPYSALLDQTNHLIENYRKAIDAGLVYCELDHEAETKTDIWIEGKKGSVPISFDDSWFDSTSKIYNHDLCRFASKMAMFGYNQEDNNGNQNELVAALKLCGFNTGESDGNKFDRNNHTEENEVNYFITSKTIQSDGKSWNLVLAAFIGTNDYQWYSDFKCGQGADHEGFALARDYVYGKLVAYMNNNGFSKYDTKILLTGHSRGAATANLLAAKLIRADDNDKLATPNNIYTYTFATPNTVLGDAYSADDGKRTDLYNEMYNRIFNIVNPEDFVTKCMPVKWGYGRYGRTFTLPSKTNTSNYDLYNFAMQEFFGSYYEKERYYPFLFGEFATYDLVQKITAEFKNSNDYYNHKINDMSLFQYFCETLCKYLANVKLAEKYGDPFKKEKGDAERELLRSTLSRNVYADIANYFLGNEGTGLTWMRKQFSNAHDMRTYCAWVNSLPELKLINHTKLEEGTGSGEWGCYKGVANCPVDIEIYNTSDNDLVGRIVNNEVDETIAAKTNSVVMAVDGDSKSFWLPSDGDYEIKLIGNDNGKMDYSLIEINSDTGEVSRTNFFNVNIIKDKTWTGKTLSEDFSVDKHTLQDENDTILRPTEQINDGEKIYTITLNTEGNGDTSGSRAAVSGDYVTVKALANDGSQFIGWYENGSLISTDTDYSFVAKSDRDLTAKFEELNPTSIRISKMPSKTVYTYKKDTSLDLTGLELEVTYSNGSKETITDKSAFKVSGYSATPKGEKTITVEYEGLKTEFKVKVKYTFWQWLIIIFLLGFIWYK